MSPPRIWLEDKCHSDSEGWDPCLPSVVLSVMLSGSGVGRMEAQRAPEGSVYAQGLSTFKRSAGELIPANSLVKMQFIATKRAFFARIAKTDSLL